MAINDKEIRELIERSFEAKTHSYSPYSKFRVGAALLCEDGCIVTGCNVENVSYGLTVCAERTAVCRAVAQGQRKFKAIAISSDLEDRFIVPCGMCRQTLKEFSTDLDLYLTKTDGTYEHRTITQLLPDAFTPTQLPPPNK